MESPKKQDSGGLESVSTRDLVVELAKRSEAMLLLYQPKTQIHMSLALPIGNPYAIDGLLYTWTQEILKKKVPYNVIPEIFDE